MDVAQSRENAGWYAYCMVGLVATLAVVPIVLRGNPWGHDVNLHLRGWMDAARQFHEGTAISPMGCRSQHGLRRTLLHFLSAAFAAGWNEPGVGAAVEDRFRRLYLADAGTGRSSMWKCASEWLAPKDALLASLLFTVNPYLLIIAYKRGNYADLLACSLLPLLVWSGHSHGFGFGADDAAAGGGVCCIVAFGSSCRRRRKL